MIGRAHGRLLGRAGASAFALALTSLFVIGHPARADYLEVRVSAALKGAPTKDADEVDRLKAGDLVELTSPKQENGYYAVRSPKSDGYVYRTLVRRHKGALPTAVHPTGGASHHASGLPIDVSYAYDAASVPKEKPKPGSYRVHLIDVGTGLAVLVQGNDFNLLYDGGSGDDKRGFDGSGNKSRLLAYLYAAIGPSGDKRCVPDGDAWAAASSDQQLVIDDVVLSHPHDDHASMLDEVISCYSVKNIWDSGAVNDAEVYADFLDAVSKEKGATYHTVSAVPVSRTVSAGGRSIHIPDEVSWRTFAENDQQSLGAGAAFRVLFADAGKYEDFNQNSIVLRVDLKDRSMLLLGDAESGERQTPDAKAGETEAYLLAHHKKELDVDILQVAHHGSMTSSRTEFLEAIKPDWAIIGCGPKHYRGVVLPDKEVVDAVLAVLPKKERLLRTDGHDKHSCPQVNRVGVDDDNPGGCDNAILTIGP